MCPSRRYKSRKSIDTEKDPYLPQKALHSTCVCEECKAVYRNKRWYRKEDFQKGNSFLKDAARILCPACQKIRDNYPGGLVVLEGEFFQKHKKEIFNLIQHEAQKALRVNPLERIIKIKHGKNNSEITTTNEILAERIGNAIHRAYKGRRDVKLSQTDKFVRIYWKR